MRCEIQCSQQCTEETVVSHCVLGTFIKNHFIKLDLFLGSLFYSTGRRFLFFLLMPATYYDSLTRAFKLFLSLFCYACMCILCIYACMFVWWGSVYMEIQGQLWVLVLTFLLCLRRDLHGRLTVRLPCLSVNFQGCSSPPPILLLGLQTHCVQTVTGALGSQLTTEQPMLH